MTAVVESNTQRFEQGEGRIYVCSVCQKAFKRSEHCIRHERGHRKEKPFSCGFCGRRYARKDLVSRHEKSFHPFGNAEHKQAEKIEGLISSARRDSQSDVSGEARVGILSNESSTRRKSISRTSPKEPERGRVNSLDANITITELNAPVHLTAHEGLEFPNPGLIQDVLSDPPTQHLPTSTVHVENSTSTNEITQNDPHNILQGFDGEGRDPDLYQPQEKNDPLFADDRSVAEDMHSHSQWDNLDIFDGDGNFGPITGPTLSDVPNIDNEHDKNTIEFDMPHHISHPSSHLEIDASMSDFLFNFGTPSLGNINMEQNLLAHFDTQPFSPTNRPDRSSPTSTDSRRSRDASDRYSSNGSCAKRSRSVIIVDEKSHETIQRDLRNCSSAETLHQFNLPSASKMQQFTTSYFISFHRHFPILHLHSITTSDTVYTPLLLAISAIGALYRLSRITAREIWKCAQVLIEPDLRRTGSMSPLPTHVVQAKLLLTVFAVFGGNIEDSVASSEVVGFWATEYRLRRSSLARDYNKFDNLSWREWSDRETLKRLLCGIFVLNSLLTVTYGTAPFLSVTQDLEVEIPDPDAKWEASNYNDWEDVPYVPDNTKRPTVKDIMLHLVFEKPALPEHFSMENRDIWSGFATTVIMHAVNIHMWHIMQCTQSFTSFPIDESAIGHTMVVQVEQALARCYSLVTNHHPDGDQSSDSNEGPQLFNCQALLRSAYVRIFTGAGSFERMMLLSENDEQILSSIQSYVRAPQARNQFLTKAVSKAYGGFLMPITTGFLLVRKTAALSWSVEHAIAGWDCALFVTKWIHGLETQRCVPGGPPNAAESENLSNFRVLLEEVDGDHEIGESIAANVANVWASFLDDTWVWGVTPRMAHLLRLLSKAYAEDWKQRSISSTDV
ncbi:zinc finger protein [Phlyctema vagabunda]|uniref:Zinc finger protein n=1 Tax=Phlyctema vagabunda TaxID=108571 RepID=A0ABR4PTL1_9HELO